MKKHFFIFLMLLFSYFISNAQSSDNPCNMHWTNVVTPLSTSLGNLMYQVQYPQNCGCGWPQVAIGHTFPFPVKLYVTLRGVKCDGTTGESGFSTGGNEVAGGYIHKENNQGNWHVFKQVIKTVAAEVRYTQNGDTYRFYYDENKGINTVQETINGLTVAEYNTRKQQQNSKNTASNSNNNSSGNSSQNGSSYHTAMNANDPRGNTGNSASQQEVQRQEQLNILNQKLNYQAQNYNNVADAVKSLANLLIGSMTQHFINEDIKGRNERFAELQNKVNTKPGILVDCSECNGEGYFTCTQCNGSGYTGDGNDRTVCSKCYGLGKTQCVHCRGTGEEFKEDYEAEYGRKSSSDNSNTDNTQQNNETSGIMSVSNDNISADECYNKGVEYNREGNQTQAFYWWQKAADQGNAKAQSALASCYYSGSNVVERNDAKAIYWYRKAANQGNAEAQGQLGLMYLYGIAVTANYTQAAYWYRKAAEQGDAGAQGQLGGLYLNGVGVAKGYAQAIYWFRKAADAGEPGSMSAMGDMYYNGTGVTKSYIQAVQWYQKAFEHKDLFSQLKLGKLYEQGGYGVTKNINTAIEWYRRAVASGENYFTQVTVNGITTNISLSQQAKEALKRLGVQE
ncbi:hypothetical protein ACFGVS_24690 [Mucilaginibacter sp. AW1-7]|uniref:hypothetical protein n=1 Tax=Mucilaginibacter sp. AW1-7 TaxID=3349874 RepID=UPI003F73C40D